MEFAGIEFNISSCPWIVSSFSTSDIQANLPLYTLPMLSYSLYWPVKNTKTRSPCLFHRGQLGSLPKASLPEGPSPAQALSPGWMLRHQDVSNLSASRQHFRSHTVVTQCKMGKNKNKNRSKTKSHIKATCGDWSHDFIGLLNKCIPLWKTPAKETLECMNSTLSINTAFQGGRSQSWFDWSTKHKPLITLCVIRFLQKNT